MKLTFSSFLNCESAVVEMTVTAITVRCHCLITGLGSSHFPHHCSCTISADVTQLKIVLTWQHPQRGSWTIFWKPLDKKNVSIKPLHTLDSLASHLSGKPSPFLCVCANMHTHTYIHVCSYMCIYVHVSVTSVNTGSPHHVFMGLFQ